MGFKLTVMLALAIFVAMYFAPGPDGSVKPPHVLERAEKLRLDEDEPDFVPVATTPAETPDGAVPVAPETPAEDVAAAAAQAPEPAGDSGQGLVSEPQPIPDLGLNLLGGSEASQALSLSDSVRARTGGETDEIDLSRPEISAAETEEAPAAPLSPLAVTRTAEVVATSVNLRAGPSTSNPVVGRVSFGQRVIVVDDTGGGWSAIQHPETGDTVFMASRFLQVLPQ
jgi:hypothetical protein